MNACLLSKGMHVHVQVFSMQKRDLGENIIMSGRTLLHLQWFLFCFVCCCFSEKKKKKKKSCSGNLGHGVSLGTHTLTVMFCAK